MRYQSLFMLAFLVLISCSSKNPSNPSDSNLSQAILGTWSSEGGYSVQFFKDGTFKDTSELTEHDRELDQRIKTGYVTRHGKYNIENTTLRMNEFYIDDIEVSGKLSGIMFVSFEYKIEIKNNKLERKRISVFTNKEKSNNSLWGVWQLDGWQSSWSLNPEEINWSGIWNKTFTFIEDSTRFKCKRESDIPDYPSTTSWYEFKYDNSSLDIPAFAEANIKVEFEDDKMIWVYDSPTELLIKK